MRTAKSLLLSSLGVLLSVVTPFHSSAQFADGVTASTEVEVATCSFSDLDSSYDLRYRVGSDEVPYLSSHAHTFNVTSNSEVKLVIQYSIQREPAGAVPSSRYAYLRQRIGGVYQNPAYASSPGETSAPMLIKETPGSAYVAALMRVKPATLPGEYKYQMTVTCLM